MFNRYDLIVVGAGHAGCEAAIISAKMGAKVMLITMNMQTIGQMSCNPAMGGVAKGQIVREIDALGGLSGIISDKTAIQYRMLNRSKGPAMWSPRTQNDRQLFSAEWRKTLEENRNIDFWQDTVKGLLIKHGTVVGVKTSLGIEIESKAVVLTNGTFLNGIIHIGEKKLGGGRISENASSGITEQLIELGFESGRMKTGTPPRLDGRSIDYSIVEEQLGDENPGTFSFDPKVLPLKKQLSCHITYTNLKTHEVLKGGFDKSPMFQGRIHGLGPRYCPSIEDKINRFADKERHQLFIEPEGWNTHEIYINGFSSSLPEEIQFKALRTISGFENVKMFRPGYAIEYDYFPPDQLKHTLETKIINNLYFAGQINGTTGYEEAACQGLMAGINAIRKINQQDEFILTRSDAYIGVLIDDLISKGTEEPYRMFTSRAEYRILLRQDNADLRLTDFGVELGTIDEERAHSFNYKKLNINKIVSFFSSTKVFDSKINGYLNSVNSTEVLEKTSLQKLLSRPQVNINDLIKACNLTDSLSNYSDVELEAAEILVKYEGYIKKEKDLAEKLERLDDVALKQNFDYSAMKSLSLEAREKLKKNKPQTLGQASRISGISPSDVSVLMVAMGR
jgi:tRNA uridine 5-carboxymethylaminomethyl modification enzyme